MLIQPNGRTKSSQLPHQELTNFHIKMRPTSTFIFKNVADPDTLSQNLALAKTNITRLLVGDTPRLIDEWQIAPQFWDAVRKEVERVGRGLPHS